MAQNSEKEPIDESSETIDTSSSLDALLNEITTRCDRQTREINKWLGLAEDFKKATADLLERAERHRRATAEFRALFLRTPTTPFMPQNTENVIQHVDI
ncbi:uncharacterized protein N7515_007211 [Penicillium bovifimosum]|uniref:Uncharacterized protein n=1 Tax=Penicillium bovifimosum TaxID=126998 RepID=A0A9W9GW56_9EURO|nr:uncharacterized protein N7515_007211 [Penicillium bovifimosum]KAJ5131172.1 hypothetical protein N7515_007211 [Penicillium bovifimosum]